MFIAGKTSLGALVASKLVDAISSAIPLAIFPIILAVAGTTIAKSVHKANLMWGIKSSLLVWAVKLSVMTGRWLKVAKVNGVTNC